MYIGGEAAAVILDLQAAVGAYSDDDVVAIAGQRLVYGVVDDLVYQVMESALIVEPMYMPGRLRTASRPSSTCICSEP